MIKSLLSLSLSLSSPLEVRHPTHHLRAVYTPPFASQPFNGHVGLRSTLWFTCRCRSVSVRVLGTQAWLEDGGAGGGREGRGEREYEQRVDVAGSCRNLKKERARCRQESRVFPTACNTAPTILYPAGAQYSQEEGDKTRNGLRGEGRGRRLWRGGERRQCTSHRTRCRVEWISKLSS